MIEEATSSKHSGTTDAPLVSVVAPCFNAEKYLEEALRSIYEQDYPNFEVIIVDDGSTDNSYAMLEQLQKVHGFQLYRQQNQGVSAALNFGLQHARGDYVATPDLDDIMLPHSLSVRAAYLDQPPGSRLRRRPGDLHRQRRPGNQAAERQSHPPAGLRLPARQRLRLRRPGVPVPHGGPARRRLL
ncbi:TPA: glycosyltransferase family 2 protein [Pseudomonas aeruginosa]